MIKSTNLEEELRVQAKNGMTVSRLRILNPELGNSELWLVKAFSHTCAMTTFHNHKKALLDGLKTITKHKSSGGSMSSPV